MSDSTRQKVYEECKKFVADAERPLEGLIEAIKEHRTDEAKSVEAPTPEPEPEPAA